LLAALGVGLSALLVAPVTMAPAQANHVTKYDNHKWVFAKDGSWWSAMADNCFTTNLEYLQRLTISNWGTQSHKFRFKWMTYSGIVAWEQKTWVVIGSNDSHTWQPAPNSTFGALLQDDHPRVKIYWVNNSGVAEKLWELHGWDPAASSLDWDGGAANGCYSL